MLSKEDPQKSFFDPDQICGNIIEEDSFYHTLHKLGPVIISDEDFKPMYCEDNGRPSVPPAIMAKLLLLQRYEDVSDREAARRARFDLGWKHALKVPVNWEGIHHSGLAHFRARLLAHEMEGIVFEKLNELAAQLGLISADHLHAVDSSHILGAAQVRDTYELIRDAMAKVIEGMEQIREEGVGEVFEEEEVERLRNKEKAEIDWADKEQRRRQLQVLVEEACRLLEVVDEEEIEEGSQAGEAAALLEKILRQDIEFPPGEGPKTYEGSEKREGEKTDREGGAGEGGSAEENIGEKGQQREEETGVGRGGKDEACGSGSGRESRESQEEKKGNKKGDQNKEVEVSIKQGVSEDRMMSVVDPQMRHGRKSSAHRFNGYTGHILEDVDAEWITDVLGTFANGGDGEVGTEPVQEAGKQTGYLPNQLVADIAYGTADNRAAYEKLDVELISPLPETRNAHGRYSKDKFEIDLEEGEVTCPNEKTTQEWTWTRDQKGRKVKRYEFGKETCEECPLRSECTTAKNGRTITLNYHEDKLKQARERQKREEFEETYARRAECERKVHEVMRIHGMRQSRYVGRRKTEMQMTWTAAVVNLKRLPELIKEKVEEAKQQVGSMLEELEDRLYPEMTPI